MKGQVYSMTLAKLLEGIEIIETNADMAAEISDVCCDSRKAGEGCLFVAVEGYETDGHKYIPSALDKGAAAVLCRVKPERDCAYILCNDTRRGLAAVSANFFGRPTEKLAMIGVTGTNGKTTSTNLVKEMYEALSGNTSGLIGTNRNMIGSLAIDTERTTPESRDLQELFAQMAEAGCAAAIMEVSSHSLYLDRVAGIRYKVGAFTNLTQDHLDFHETMENYCDAKAILFKNCEVGVVNADDEWTARLTKDADCRIISYSAKENGGDLFASDIRYYPDKVCFTANYGGESAPATINIPGKFSVYNALTAMGCILALGYGLAETAAALADCHGVQGRVEVVPTGRDFTMLIDYAHTPDGIDNVLRAVKETAPGRVGILFGCGGDRDRTKRPKMGAISAALADYMIITSDNPRTEEPEAIIADILEGIKDTKTPYVVITDRREAIKYAIEHAGKDDTIILAGKGHETYQIVGKTKYHMDEREIVAEVLAALPAQI